MESVDSPGDLLLGRVWDYICRHRLLPPEARVIVAVSGGVDSVVLLELLHRLDRWPLAVAHCNFHLRGEASDRDAAFVTQLAHAHSLPFFIQEWNTLRYCHEQGVSVEEGARQLRYEWFEQLLESQGYTHLALAHQATDQAETMLLNLARGAGPLGMRGMPRARGHYVRPLLCLTRDEVATWARTQGLQWVEDATNQDTTIRRNLLRHEVLPRLRQLNPQAVRHMAQASERLMDLLEAVGGMLRKRFGDWDTPLRKPQGPLPYTQDEALLPLYCEWLRRRFTFLRLSAAVVEDLLAGMERPRVGRHVEGTNVAVWFTQEGLLLTPRELSDDIVVSLPVPGAIETLGFRFTAHIELCPPFVDQAALKSWSGRGRWCVCLDADRCQGGMTIRSWRAGDRLCPLGMRGRKLVSDILTDGKLRTDLRAVWPVVLCGSEVAWVVGYRQGADFALQLGSRKALVVECDTING